MAESGSFGISRKAVAYASWGKNDKTATKNKITGKMINFPIDPNPLSLIERSIKMWYADLGKICRILFLRSNF